MLSDDGEAPAKDKNKKAGIDTIVPVGGRNSIGLMATGRF